MSRLSEARPFEEQQQQRYISYEEFLDWADEDTLAEWVDGAVVMTGHPSLRHQEIVNFLIGILSTFSEIHALGEVIDGPFQMKLGRSGRDRGDKFYEYREAGIPEYWLIDPQLQQAGFYQLDAAGVYQSIQPDASGIYRSRVLPGFWLRVEWLWKEPLPDATQALLTIGRDAYTRYLQERLEQPDL